MPLRARERLDVSHLDHGRREVGGKGRRRPAVLRHDAVGRAAAEENLIGCEEPLLPHQVLEVVVVERVGCHQVQGRQVRVAPARRATSLPGARKAGVDVRAVAVDSPTEREALG